MASGSRIEPNDKRRALLGKLQAMARRGIGGERENARRKLDALLAKLGLTPDEFELNEDRALRRFRVPKYKKLFGLIACEVLDVDTIRYRRTRSGREIAIECTPAQAVEIEMIYAAYRRGLEREIETLKEAYFYRNNLYAQATRPFDEKYSRDKTLAIQRMAERMSRTMVHKQIDE
jgi:hypothetical protein